LASFVLRHLGGKVCWCRGKALLVRFDAVAGSICLGCRFDRRINAIGALLVKADWCCPCSGSMHVLSPDALNRNVLEAGVVR
jgi:hypothetical protein